MKVFALVCFIGCLGMTASQGLVSGASSSLSSQQVMEAAKTTIAEAVSAALSNGAAQDPVRAQLWCPLSLCTADYNPVCGFSLCGGLRTFPNKCGLTSYNQCNFPGYAPLFAGKCEDYFKCRRPYVLPLEPLPLPVTPVEVDKPSPDVGVGIVPDPLLDPTPQAA